MSTAEEQLDSLERPYQIKVRGQEFGCPAWSQTYVLPLIQKGYDVWIYEGPKPQDWRDIPLGRALVVRHDGRCVIAVGAPIPSPQGWANDETWRTFISLVPHLLVSRDDVAKALDDLAEVAGEP